MFELDRAQIMRDGVHLTPEATALLPAIEHAINDCFVRTGHTPVQHGRVIALRHTDTVGLSSAFSASLYMGKYDDATNKDRLHRMLKAGHSYEPLRGESVSFLFIGVGKPVYNHLVTYTIRNRRICGGMRANAPWGFTVPHEAKDPERYVQDMAHSLVLYQRCVQRGEPPQAARSILPAGIVLPPFQLDFTEEALAKNVFKQRIWEAGAQGETKTVVNDMHQCCLELDPEKWEALYEAISKPTQHHRVMEAMKATEPILYKDLMDEYDTPAKSMWGK